MFSGIVTGTIMFSRGKISQSPKGIAGRIRQIVEQDGQHISSAMSNEIQQASRPLRKYIETTGCMKVNEIYQLYNEIESERLCDDVHISAQISLSRIPGLKSFGYWKDDFEVSVCEERWKRKLPNLLQILRDAVRGDKTANEKGIEEENIHLRSSEKCLDFHLFTGEAGKSCFGSVTLFGQRIQDNRLVCFTCKHVVPKKNAYVTLFEKCDHSQVNGEDRDCANFTGVCIHTHGVEDGNELGDGFVDISCVCVNEPCPIDTSIQGPTPSRKRKVLYFNGNFRQRQGMDVYKKGRDNKTAYGTYIDAKYLTPNEDEEENNGQNRIWDCGHDHSVNIPFSHGPRRIDLVEESADSEISFGDRGNSGGFVSFLSWNGDTDEVTPALVYVGKWPDRDNVYMCYRLHEAIECLTSNDLSAQFSLNYDDDNFHDIHKQRE